MLSFLEKQYDDQVQIFEADNHNSSESKMSFDVEIKNEDSLTFNDESSPTVYEESLSAYNGERIHESEEPPAKRIKISLEDDVGDKSEILGVLKEIRDSVKPKRDAIRIFFESVVETVIKFPKVMQAEAKLKVCQVISELEVKLASQENTEEALDRKGSREDKF